MLRNVLRHQPSMLLDILAEINEAGNEPGSPAPVDVLSGVCAPIVGRCQMICRVCAVAFNQETVCH
jgi:hypothetical protein